MFMMSFWGVGGFVHAQEKVPRAGRSRTAARAHLQERDLLAHEAHLVRAVRQGLIGPRSEVGQLQVLCSEFDAVTGPFVWVTYHLLRA